ncbi:FAD-dependent monooxygenase [Arenibacterium halophilum]|uniref:FAD-binding protein n=1 Tax=Arenibacterium halophilum TaxID=2583821 RepID=A0ABY2XCE7_9RHOB|nr:FAD-dependent monooxygenase [Arenibacterium halophilum]TMV14694.1 FAD-binding protein [Arenibacterium halophilum]
MALTGQEITVLGAGIGGLTAALALARRGARVRVLEQAEALTEVGAGIQIAQNGMVVLRALGVFDDPPPAVCSQGVDLRDYRAGRLVMRLPPPAAGPTWYFHRADLIKTLARAAQAAGVNIELGQTAVAVSTVGGAACIHLASGREMETPLLIAADGMRGPGRAAVAGDTIAEFSGQVAYRALVPGQPGAPERATLTMAPGRHAVTYPLRDGKVTNIVAFQERRDWERDSWRDTIDAAEVRATFADFGGPVGQLFQRIETAHIWALYLHPVASQWHKGAIALLGDAAHPTLPYMAQGACMAIEDAWVLADCLTNDGGFAAYQARRIERVRRVVAAAGANAWRFHARSPMREIGQLGLTVAGRWLAPRYTWLYGHDVTSSPAL